MNIHDKIKPEELIDKQFSVVSAGIDHLHLRELGTGEPVDVLPLLIDAVPETETKREALLQFYGPKEK